MNQSPILLWSMADPTNINGYQRVYYRERFKGFSTGKSLDKFDCEKPKVDPLHLNHMVEKQKLPVRANKSPWTALARSLSPETPGMPGDPTFQTNLKPFFVWSALKIPDYTMIAEVFFTPRLR